MKKDTFFEVGQIVYCAIYGKGLVVRVTPDGESKHPISVKFEKEGIGTRSYTYDGKYNSDGRITLCQTPIPEIVNKPIVKLEIGELCWGFVDDWVLLRYENNNEGSDIHDIITVSNITEWRKYDNPPFEIFKSSEKK